MIQMAAALALLETFLDVAQSQCTSSLSFFSLTGLLDCQRKDWSRHNTAIPMIENVSTSIYGLCTSEHIRSETCINMAL